MSDEFDFSKDDTVLVRHRENGDTGKLQAKFVAEVHGFRTIHPMLSSKVILLPPWTTDALRLKHDEAEFEVIDDKSEVHF